MDARVRSDITRPIVHNHLDNSKSICNKNEMIKSLEQFYMLNEHSRRAHYKVFDTTPITFTIDLRVDRTNEIDRLYTKFKELSFRGYVDECMPAKHCQANMWLVKPAYYNRGRGIGIFKNMREIQDYIFRQNS
jgi:hypothetical protein